jgi:hypothetical protein
MNWAIHTKGPTSAADLKAALDAERDALLGSESLAASRKASLDKLQGAIDSMPTGEARDALITAMMRLESEPAQGIADKDLRAAIATQADAGIAAACDVAALGPVNVTVSGCAGRIDEDTLGRLTVQVDFVDLVGLAARLAREAPAEKPITVEGSVTAPPV